MFYYLYKITNLVNGKIYVGIHRTQTLEDGYMGSGVLLKRAILKYGSDKFNKEILQLFQTEAEMVDAEKMIVTETFINDPMTYNISIGGYGSFFHINSTVDLDQGMPLEKRRQQRKAAGVKGGEAMKRRLAADENLRRSVGIRLQETRKQLNLPSPALSLRWVWNPTTKEQKYVNQSVISEYLDSGWLPGRKGGWGKSKSI